MSGCTKRQCDRALGVPEAAVEYHAGVRRDLPRTTRPAAQLALAARKPGAAVAPCSARRFLARTGRREGPGRGWPPVAGRSGRRARAQRVWRPAPAPLAPRHGASLLLQSPKGSAHLRQVHALRSRHCPHQAAERPRRPWQAAGEAHEFLRGSPKLDARRDARGRSCGSRGPGGAHRSRCCRSRRRSSP
jgi:hypothetical protein